MSFYRHTLIALWLGYFVLATQAYIPALPTNNSDAVAAGVNQTDTSSLSLQWWPNGSYSETVSYQLVGVYTTGINEGALVHFMEQNLTNDTTTTPWIALVSCDANTTGFSLEVDIFTLARDRGAVAALLYSEWSDACLINPAYADPASFDQIMDIFSTKSLSSSQTIENQFTTVNETLYYEFNASRLNDSAALINSTLSTGEVSQPSYLFATLMAANATPPDDGSSTGDNTTNNSSGGRSNSTDLAMIVLYVITGAVSALFCIVILSGAIRAIRHPERYGPRTGGDPAMGGGYGQSRARGLTRAIVDTFPIIKFSRNADDPVDPLRKASDVESRSTREHPVEMTSRRSAEVPAPALAITTDTMNDVAETPGENVDHQRMQISTTEAGSSSLPSPTSPHAAHTDRDIVPAAIGRDTCPICIVDFEEGDDLRVLPCEGKHVFHQQCVDPWLLELSSSCPICRQDFNALETMIAGGSSDGHAGTEYHAASPTTHNANRFSRYLKFARGRRGRNWGNRDSYTEDPTDPPFPLAHSTDL